MFFFPRRHSIQVVCIHYTFLWHWGHSILRCHQHAERQQDDHELFLVQHNLPVTSLLDVRCISWLASGAPLTCLGLIDAQLLLQPPAKVHETGRKRQGTAAADCWHWYICLSRRLQISCPTMTWAHHKVALWQSRERGNTCSGLTCCDGIRYSQQTTFFSILGLLSQG
jgi:hypothetical protein